MAWWITIYCRKSVAGLGPDELRAGITGGDSDALAGVDYLTLAESYEVDESLVKPALESLQVTAGLEIRYRPDPALRPIAIHVWTDPERVTEEVAETRESRDPPPDAESFLGACREIVAIELGFPMLEDMGVVIAYEGARYLAQKGDGVIVDDDDRWHRVDRGGFVPLEAA